jgi:hypothetical protein
MLVYAYASDCPMLIILKKEGTVVKEIQEIEQIPSVGVDPTESILCDCCQEKFDALLGAIYEIEDEIQVSLQEAEFIRSTHIIEAPTGKDFESFLGRNDEALFDLFIFMPRSDFELLKRGFDERWDIPVVTFKYSPEDWKERLAS